MSTYFCRDDIPVWVPFDGINIPKNAVQGGKDGTQKLYIGRAHHSGSLTPGKVPEIQKELILPWGTISNTKQEFEILISHLDSTWAAAERGNVPVNAFPGGHSEQGETLYIGRYMHQGALTVGKIQPSHQVCYIAHGSTEMNSIKYEVLVV